MLPHFSRLNDSMFMLPLLERDRQPQRCALTRRRVDVELPAEVLRTVAYILQPVPSASVCGCQLRPGDCEPPPVVTNLRHQSVMRYVDAERDRITAGVAGDVVNGLFEEQIEVAALLRVELDSL